MIAIQDTYPFDVAHCYGCGVLNEHGHQIKTVLDGELTITEFTPLPNHVAVPGFVYGGLIASLIDCHSTGSAAIYKMVADGKAIGSEEAPRFVTAHLEVDYRKPTPLGFASSAASSRSKDGRWSSPRISTRTSRSP